MRLEFQEIVYRSVFKLGLVLAMFSRVNDYDTMTSYILEKPGIYGELMSHGISSNGVPRVTSGDGFNVESITRVGKF